MSFQKIELPQVDRAALLLDVHAAIKAARRMANLFDADEFDAADLQFRKNAHQKTVVRPLVLLIQEYQRDGQPDERDTVKRLLESLRPKSPNLASGQVIRDRCDAVLELIPEAGAEPGDGKTATKRKKRATSPRKSRPLTPRQTEVIQIVGECKGNIAEAARRLGIDRKTVDEAYKAGMAKLGKDVCRLKKSDRVIARDKRGQLDVSDIDDNRRDSDEEHRRKYGRG